MSNLSLIVFGILCLVVLSQAGDLRESEELRDIMQRDYIKSQNFFSNLIAQQNREAIEEQNRLQTLRRGRRVQKAAPASEQVSVPIKVVEEVENLENEPTEKHELGVGKPADLGVEQVHQQMAGEQLTPNDEEDDLGVAKLFTRR